MNLIYHKNDISLFADFFDQAFHSAFKLSAELCSGNQGSQVKQINLFFEKFHRYFAHSNTLGQALSDCGFSDSWFPDQAWVVFLPAIQNLNHAFQFFFPADHGIQLTRTCTGCQINTVIVQKLMFLLFPVRLTLCLSRISAALTATAAYSVLRLLVLIRILLSIRFSRTECIKNSSEERKRRCFSVVIIRAVAFVGTDQILHPVQRVHHFTGKIVQIFIRDPHFCQNVVNRFDMKFSCTFQAKTFTSGLSVFYFCYKYNRGVFPAARAHTSLHVILTFKRSEYKALQKAVGQESKRHKKSCKKGLLQCVSADNQPQKTQQPA